MKDNKKNMGNMRDFRQQQLKITLRANKINNKNSNNQRFKFPG
jgi:hypothetical protein